MAVNGLLDESYARCKELTRAAGTTYYWSTYLLPADQRPHVWALYAFCRLADDIVDDVGPLAPEERERVTRNFKRGQQMTPEERARLRERFERMTPEEGERSRERMPHHGHAPA